MIAGDYELRVRVLHAGTRSEGRVGGLYRGGKTVVAGSVGEVIEVPDAGGTIRFVFLGDERPHLWSVSGWAVQSPPDLRTPPGQ